MSTKMLWSRGRALDPRWFQLAALSTLLVLGIGRFGLDVAPASAAVIVFSALATQWMAERLRASGGNARGATERMGLRSAGFEWKSALISSLSLCLLLRARHPGWLAAAAALAVGSKFALRVPTAEGRGSKHVLNPTNGAIVLLLAAGAPVWVSPSQWGHHLPLAFGIAAFGSLVVHRSARSDVTFAFLAFWSALLFSRAAWVGQPLAVPLHQLENGGLALFAFHMISDPKTTPDSRAGRVVFAALVVLVAGFVQFVLFRRDALMWSLAACSLVVPLLDRGLPGKPYEWNASRDGAIRKETSDAKASPVHGTAGADPVPA